MAKGEPSPQLEKGFTRFANEWLVAFIGWQGPAKLKDLVWAIARETWGYQDSWRAITPDRLAAMLHISTRRVMQLREEAIRHCLIDVQKGELEGKTACYRIHKEYLDWLEYSPSQRARKQASEMWSTEKNVIPSDEAETRKDGVPSTEEKTEKDVVPSTRKDGVPSGEAGPTRKDVLPLKAKKGRGGGPSGVVLPLHLPSTNDSSGTPKPDASTEDAKQRETEQSLAIQAAWEAFGHTTVATDPPGAKRKYYSKLTLLIKKRGLPQLRDWIGYLGQHPPRPEDWEGADPWEYFCTEFERAMGLYPGWKKEAKPRGDTYDIEPPPT